MERIERSRPPAPSSAATRPASRSTSSAEGRTPGSSSASWAPTSSTRPAICTCWRSSPRRTPTRPLWQRMKEFAENVLGKGVVVCKDTPNFVANRMISFIQSDLMEFAIENGYTRRGRGCAHRAAAGPPQDRHLPPQRHRRHRRDGDGGRKPLRPDPRGRRPRDSARRVWHGGDEGAGGRTSCSAPRAGQGFYKTVVDEKGKKSFWGLDLQTAAEDGKLEYVAPKKPKWSSVGEARNLPLAERLKALVRPTTRPAS
jgi:3-hydroxyacyl-CoA dehydrogenase